MAKRRKPPIFLFAGLDFGNDAQRASAEKDAAKGWEDDEAIVVEAAFGKKLRAAIYDLHRAAGVPINLCYKISVRCRIAHAGEEFSRKGSIAKKALKEAKALCRALESLGSPPNVYWRDSPCVAGSLKVSSRLPDLRCLRDHLALLCEQFTGDKRTRGRPRDTEKAEFQRIMVSLLPDSLRKKGQRMDKQFAALYELVSGRKQNPESYRYTRRRFSEYRWVEKTPKQKLKAKIPAEDS